MSSLVRTVYNKPWIPYDNKVEFYLCNSRKEFPAPVTTVHGFFFDDEKRILLVEHYKRGWEVPGGHIEEGESFEEAMHRELLEEAQAISGPLNQLGFLKKIALEAKPEDCTYPHPESYCLFYSGRINKKSPFKGDDHIVAADYFTLDTARENAWIQAYNEYFEAALKSL